MYRAHNWCIESDQKDTLSSLGKETKRTKRQKPDPDQKYVDRVVHILLSTTEQDRRLNRPS